MCSVASVVSNSVTLWTVAHQAWDSPGRNPGVGCCFLLQGIFLTQGSNLYFLHLLRCQVASLPLVPPGKKEAFHWIARERNFLRNSYTLLSLITSAKLHYRWRGEWWGILGWGQESPMLLLMACSQDQHQLVSISPLSHAGRRQQRASGHREVCAQNSSVGSPWLSWDPLSFLLLSMWLGPETGGAPHGLGHYDGWTQASRPSEPMRYN